MNNHQHVAFSSSLLTLCSPSLPLSSPLQPAEFPLTLQRLSVLRGSPEVHGENLGSQELRVEFSGSSTPPELGSEAVDHGEWEVLVVFGEGRVRFTHVSLSLSCVCYAVDALQETLTPTPSDELPEVVTTPPPDEEVEEQDESCSPVANGELPSDSRSTLRASSAVDANSFQRQFNTPELSGKVHMLCQAAV